MSAVTRRIPVYKSTVVRGYLLLFIAMATAELLLLLY